MMATGRPLSEPIFDHDPMTVAKATTKAACTMLRTAVERSESSPCMPILPKMLMDAAQTAARMA